MEYKIKVTFETFQDAIKFIGFLIDNGIDPETQIHPTHITRHPIVGHIVEQHIVDYIVDDECVDPEDVVAYDIEFLERNHIVNYHRSHT